MEQENLPANSTMQTKNDAFHELKFIGNGGEYFKIWITNILLSIITIGIYSPWAKVRNNQYLYGATQLDKIGFEYTADPVKILIGRLIVVGLYISVIIIGDVLNYTTVAAVLSLAFTLLIPWLVRQAVRFRMRYTRYKGVHFNHRASVWDYYKFFLIHWLLLIVTLGLILPYTLKEFNSLVLNNTYYGDEKFDFSASGSLFYVAYGKVFAIILAFGVIAAIIFTSMSGTRAALGTEMFIGIFVIYIGFLLLTFAIKGFLQAWIGNIINNNTTLGRFKFNSFWSGTRLAWIHFSNFFMLSFTMGLMYPWAKIRVINHKIDNFFIEGENVDDFVNAADEQTKALGEEVADFFDFDIGF